MAGDEEPYISVRSFLTEVSPKNVQILALYVNKESHKKFLDPVNQRLENYFLLSTIRPLVDKELSVKDFAELKKGFIKAQEQLKTALRQKANDMLNNASDGALGIGAVDSLGVFDASDTSFSFMAVVDQVSDADGQRTVDKQSAVSSFLLAQGKVIIINQYQILDPSKDMAQQLDAAKTQAQPDPQDGKKQEKYDRLRLAPIACGQAEASASHGQNPVCREASALRSGSAVHEENAT